MHHTRLVCAFSLIRAPRCTVVAQVMHSGGSAGFSNASTCTFFSLSFAHKHAFSLSLSLTHKQPHLAAWMLFLSLSVYFLSRLLSLSLFFLLGRSLSLFLSRVMDSYAAQHEYAVSRSIHSLHAVCQVSAGTHDVGRCELATFPRENNWNGVHLGPARASLKHNLPEQASTYTD